MVAKSKSKSKTESKSIEDQRAGHVARAKKAGLGPLIKKNRTNMDDSYSGSQGPWDKEKAVSDQVLKGYFSGNLRSKKPIAEESDMETDIQNAVNNYYREDSARQLAQMTDTAKPQRIQVTPGKWSTISSVKVSNDR